MENFAAPQVLVSETQATNVGLLTMVYAPSDARIVYIGTIGKGVYRSVDAGMSWIHFGLGGNNIRSLAVDPIDPNLAYATIDYYGSMMVTTKGNEILWKDSSYLPANFYSVATSPFAPGKVYVGTSIGFYSYQNQTNAWTALGLSGQTVTAVAVDPTHPGVLYAGTTNGAYYSLNYGSTWSLVDNRLGSQTITSINFNKTNPELIYFSTKTHGIFLATIRF
jgi:ligand-binding sensor domain-containing protein